MTTILLTGKNGQVGCELQRALSSFEIITAVDITEMDLAHPDSIRRTIRKIAPDIIINSAAYTAVDQAESEPELAMAVNGIAPRLLAEEALSQGALLVHYSTDYVFDGNKSVPYTEDDLPNPQNIYGQTKLVGEQAIQASGCKFIILRTSWIYGVHSENFVKTILRLAHEREELRIVADQFGTPTWAKDLADATASILHFWQQANWNNSLSGLYHLTAAGQTNWYQYAKEIVRLAQCYDAALTSKPPNIRAITTAEYAAPAKRPANSMLANNKVYEAFGIRLPSWQDSLAQCVEQLYKQTNAKPD